MDIKQNYREETNLEPYAGDDERHPSYSNNYVRWLEQQLILHGVVGRSELFKCACGSTNLQKNKIHNSIMCNDCKTVYANI